MKSRPHWIAAGALSLTLAAGVAWAVGDSPNSQPPFGLSDLSGAQDTKQQLMGFVTTTYRCWNELDKATSLSAVMRLMHGNRFEAFYFEHDCSQDSAVEACEELCFNGQVDVLDAVKVARCITEGVEGQVLTAFDIAGTGLALKNVVRFAASPASITPLASAVCPEADTLSEQALGLVAAADLWVGVTTSEEP